MAQRENAVAVAILRAQSEMTAHEESSTVGLAHCDRAICTSLAPPSLWYAICAVTMLEYTPHVSNPLPIPFPELVSYALGLVLMHGEWWHFGG